MEWSCEYRNRLDVYGLAMPAEVSENNRIVQCIAHQQAEIVERRGHGHRDLHTQRWHWGRYPHARFIIIAAKETGDWDQKEMIFVWFDLSEEECKQEDPAPEVWAEIHSGSEEIKDTIVVLQSAFSWQAAVNHGEFDNA